MNLFYDVYEIPNWDNRGNSQKYIRQVNGEWIDCYNEIFVPESRVIKVMSAHCQHLDKCETGTFTAVCNECGTEVSTRCDHVTADITPHEYFSTVACIRCGMGIIDILAEQDYLEFIRETNEINTEKQS